jgi:hypothetical protein
VLIDDNAPVKDALAGSVSSLQPCGRAVDYDEADALFAPDVVGFGTYKEMGMGCEAPPAEEWLNIWRNVRDFSFRLELLHCGAEGALAWGGRPVVVAGPGGGWRAFRAWPGDVHLRAPRRPMAGRAHPLQPLPEAGRMTAPNLPIGQIVRNARLFNFRRPAMFADEITQVVADLFSLFQDRQIDYLLVGGIALLSYVEGRNTEAIDVILAASDLGRLPELEVESRDANFVQASYRGLRVDILLTQNPFFEHVRRKHATQREFDERPVAIVAPEGLVLLKFYALPPLYRQADFKRVALYETDLVLLLHRYPMRAEDVLAVLADYLPDHDVQSLREIYGEIEARIRRYSGSAT